MHDGRHTARPGGPREIECVHDPDPTVAKFMVVEIEYDRDATHLVQFHEIDDVEQIRAVVILDSDPCTTSRTEFLVPVRPPTQRRAFVAVRTPNMDVDFILRRRDVEAHLVEKHAMDLEF